MAKKLKPLSIPPGERIVTEGEVGQSMFFLMRGLVEVCSGLKVLALLNDGAVFGEMALLIVNQPRTATIRALVFSDVFELSQSDLEEALILWPNLRTQLTKTMQVRKGERREEREEREGKERREKREEREERGKRRGKRREEQIERRGEREERREKREGE